MLKWRGKKGMGEWQRVFPNQEPTWEQDLIGQVPTVNSKRVVVQLGASESSFQNLLDLLGLSFN